MRLAQGLECTCDRFRQVARLLSRHYDGFFVECGISIGQFGLLVRIAATPGESISWIAERLKMERTTLTRNLAPLREAGYVVLGPGSDRRSRSLRLTPTGERTLKAALPRWKAAQKDLEQRIGTRRKERLHREIDDLLDRLGN